MIRIYIIIGLLIFNTGCGDDIIYKGNKDLIGNWEAANVEIVDNSYNGVRFGMDRYGYSTINFNADSTYSFRMEITRDVILEKEVFGNQFEKVVLNAGYVNYRRGYYYASDTSIILYDANKIFSNEYRYDFRENNLFTYFKDKDNKSWKIKWEK